MDFLLFLLLKAILTVWGFECSSNEGTGGGKIRHSNCSFCDCCETSFVRQTVGWYRENNVYGCVDIMFQVESQTRLKLFPNEGRSWCTAGQARRWYWLRQYFRNIWLLPLPGPVRNREMFAKVLTSPYLLPYLPHDFLHPSTNLLFSISYPANTWMWS